MKFKRSCTFFFLFCLSTVCLAAPERPCANGEVRVRHAYSECNKKDGFWYVVEDNYYACPPKGAIKKYRVAEIKTAQKCGDGQPRPKIAGTTFKALSADDSCVSAKQIGSIVIAECIGDSWALLTYDLYECLDKSRRISIPASGIQQTTTPCQKEPPAPNVR
ncbi:hypothetical protein L0156_12895 [bacterium]|nr:hypothetical protein [bacterium]